MTNITWEAFESAADNGTPLTITVGDQVFEVTVERQGKMWGKTWVNLYINGTIIGSADVEFTNEPNYLSYNKDSVVFLFKDGQI